MERLTVKNVSYLQARDPSILAWNRVNLKKKNLNLEFLEETSQDTQEVREKDISNYFVITLTKCLV